MFPHHGIYVSEVQLFSQDWACHAQIYASGDGAEWDVLLDSERVREKIEKISREDLENILENA
jgi:hypothetical protein